MHPPGHSLLGARLLGEAAGNHHLDAAVGDGCRPDARGAAGMIEARAINAEAVRADFPILGRTINGKPLVYLDSAATSQKPAVLIGIMDDYYRPYHPHPHPGGFHINQEATPAHQSAPQPGAAFLKAAPAKE